MILAQALQQSPPDANSFLNWVLSAILIISLVAAVKSFFDRKKGGVGDPLNVRFDDHYVSRREFDNRFNQSDKNHVRLEGDLKAMAATSEAREQRVMEKLDERDEKITNQILRFAKATEERFEKESKWAYDGRDKLHERVTQNGNKIAAVEQQVKQCPRPLGCERDTE